MNLMSSIKCFSASVFLSVSILPAVADVGTAETLLSGTQTIQTQAVYGNGSTRYKLLGFTTQGVEFETRSGGSYAYGQYSNGVEIFDANDDNYWDNNIDDNSSSAFPKAALDAHWAAGRTLDYFHEVLGVRSFDDLGGKVTANVHSYRHGSWEYQNGIYSFSDTSQDANHLPWVSVDLVAHEIAHSMLDTVLARPEITSLPDIFDEGFADVIGISVRHYAKPATANFEFADEIYANGYGSLRSLSNPVVDTYLSSAWNNNPGKYTHGGVLGKWFYLASVGGAGVNGLGVSYQVNGIGTEVPVKVLYQAFEDVSGAVTLEDYASSTVARAYAISDQAGDSIRNAWTAVGVESSVSSWKRTVIFIYGQTVGGQDLFVRGGIDHGYANSVLGRSCSISNFECAMPIQHNNLLNSTTSPWKNNDSYLDWYGAQQGQNTQSQGTPLDWTTDFWPMDWGQTRSIDVDGFGYTPLNTYGAHYWMLDVNMDCSAAVDGWFELKSFVSNGPGWESDVNQVGAPYESGNHFAQCGKINVFSRGQNNPIAIRDFAN